MALIVERTQKGKDRFGASFEPYSTRPFALPAGGTKRKRDALDELDAGYFQRNGALWAIVTGGYAAYKKERYPAQGAGETVNLTATGLMLEAVSVISVGTAGTGASVTLGFTSAEAAERAYYYTQAGASPSRTIRDFFGLTEREADRIAEEVGEAITIET